MPTSIGSDEFRKVLEAARRAGATREPQPVSVDGEEITIRRPFASPEDWRDVWIYHLMVDRFSHPAGAAPRRPPPDGKGWDASTCNAFQGGTIEGVRRNLEYLRDLGAGAVWLSPVLKTTSGEDAYHGYGIQDFLRVDPRFGTARELRALVDEAHERGLYVVADIVLNHAGDVFSYALDDGGVEHEAAFREFSYAVQWNDEHGNPNPLWTECPRTDPALPRGAAVWPRELQHNGCFRRQGKGDERGGDFASLKELVTGSSHVRDVLIKVHQYLIALFDFDGFRIDTVKYVERDFEQIFCNAMREFALFIGKRNFFTFVEVWDSEEKVASFVGRNAANPDELVGADAALDFPLFSALPQCVKGFQPPSRVAEIFAERKRRQAGILSSHAEAGRYFVTFNDNHDQKERFNCGKPEYFNQVPMGVALLFSLQGIPCVYYGTEQGLSGAGENERAVREPLWPRGFDRGAQLYLAIKAISRVRAACPSLRYGRQYFRQVSGDGYGFAVSTHRPGVIAYSRIEASEEVVVVCNTAPDRFDGYVVVDRDLTPVGRALDVLYSNKGSDATRPDAAVERRSGAQAEVVVRELDGSTSSGPVTAIPVHLAPMEAQILGVRPPAL